MAVNRDAVMWIWAKQEHFGEQQIEKIAFSETFSSTNCTAEHSKWSCSISFS